MKARYFVAGILVLATACSSGEGRCAYPLLDLEPRDVRRGQPMRIQAQPGIRQPCLEGGSPVYFVPKGTTSLHVSISRATISERQDALPPVDVVVEELAEVGFDEEDGSMRVTVSVPEGLTNGSYFVFLREEPSIRSDLFRVVG